MGAWLGVGGCYEVDCTSPTLHSTKSTKSTSAPVQQSGTKAPVGATLKFKVAGFRAVDRKQGFPVIAEGKISGFFGNLQIPMRNKTREIHLIYVAIPLFTINHHYSKTTSVCTPCQLSFHIAQFDEVAIFQIWQRRFRLKSICVSCSNHIPKPVAKTLTKQLPNLPRPQK